MRSTYAVCAQLPDPALAWVVRSWQTMHMKEEVPIARLSTRQLACLRLVAELKKTEQIAAELGISPSTVNTHIERAVTMLGAANRREAARLVTQSLPQSPIKSPTETLRLAERHDTPPFVQAAAVGGKGRQRNDLSWEQRLGLALLALAMLCIALAGLGAAIEQLSRWRTSALAERAATR